MFFFPKLKRYDAQILIGVSIRNSMGLSFLLFCSIQSIMIAKNIIKGNINDTDNPFHWSKIEENLPFSESYKTSLPKLRKVRVNGRHGSEMVI